MSPNLIKPGSRTRRRLVFRASEKSMTVILGALLIEVTPVCGRRCTGHIKTSVNLEPTDSDFHLWITDRVLEPSCKSDADATYCPPVYAVFLLLNRPPARRRLRTFYPSVPDGIGRCFQHSCRSESVPFDATQRTAGILSRRSAVSSPITCIALWQQGQAVLSGASVI
jgi:hypothetical protein